MAVKAQKQPQCPMASTNEDSVMPWWKELGIPKSDVKMLPEGCLCVFCQSAVDCDKKFGEFLTHSFTGKFICGANMLADSVFHAFHLCLHLSQE